MTGAANSSDACDGPGLTAAVIRFSSFLKRRGFNVSHGSARDAVCSLLEIDPLVKADFFAALRTALAKNDSEWRQFSALFDEFWSGRQQEEVDSREIQAPAEGPPASQVESESFLKTFGSPAAEAAAEQEAATGATSYSPIPAVERQFAACFEQADIPRAGKALRDLLAPFRLDRSRRFKAPAGRDRLDFPLVMRRSLKYDGLPLELLYRTRRKKLKRVVFLIDVSGSMDRYTQMLLPFILSLRRVGAKTEVFVFSTALARITAFLRRRHTAQILSHLGRDIPDWSGGTRIGRCLQQFNRGAGRRLLGPKTVVTILSDGWDLGEKELLRAEMATLRRKSGRIVWLNPLAADPDYQPLCQGMKAALPYLDHFLPAGNLNDLCRAGHLIARIISA